MHNTSERVARHWADINWGVLKATAKTVTIAVLGIFKTDAAASSEALSLIRSRSKL